MTNTMRALRVFLCHASNDKEIVQNLYERLINDGIDAWLDKEKLLPGQDWKLEITKAVKESDVVIVCLSKHSVTKEGFVQWEIKFALDVTEEKPEGTIFIIPAKLEVCDVPEKISRYQWVDLFINEGYERLVKALQVRSKSVGATIRNLQTENKPNSVLADQSKTQDNGGATSPKKLAPDPATKQLIQYLKALEYLHKKEPATLKYILTMVNRFVADKDGKSIKAYHGLAERMLSYKYYKKVVEYAEGLIQNANTLSSFLGQLMDETGSMRGTIVADYMTPLPKEIFFSPRATLGDLITFFKNASPDMRYFIVLNDNGTLRGWITLTAFAHTIQEIKSLDKDTLVTSLSFFIADPKVVHQSDKMEYVIQEYNKGKPTTRLIVVDDSNRPVGMILSVELAFMEFNQ